MASIFCFCNAEVCLRNFQSAKLTKTSVMTQIMQIFFLLIRYKFCPNFQNVDLELAKEHR